MKNIEQEQTTAKDLASEKRNIQYKNSIHIKLKRAFRKTGLMSGIIIAIAIIVSFFEASQLKAFQKGPYKIVSLTETSKVSSYRILYNLNQSVLCLGYDNKMNYYNIAIEEQKLLEENLNTLKQAGSKKDSLEKISQLLTDSVQYREKALEYTEEDNGSELALSVLRNNFVPIIEDVIAELETMSVAASDSAQAFVTRAQITALLGMIFVVILLLLNTVFSSRISSKITKDIQSPAEELANALDDLSRGKLDIQIMYDDDDELGHVAQCARNTVEELKSYINNISSVLGKLSSKDMTAVVDIEYAGQFQPIKESLTNITQSLNEMVYSIRESSLQVTAGAEQIASTAQSLADGASDQSSSVEELLASIHEVSENVTNNAQKAENVADISKNSATEAEKGNVHMQHLVNAMGVITKESREISNIIQVIDEIASQTNLLSLNASIEAARAGEHGRGFAVVASEIGKLANECSEAARTTSELITKSIQAVNDGSNLVDETAQVLKEVVNSSTQTSSLVKEISDACSLQDEYLQEVLQGIQQIASVVESNSAAAEESSAASEELLSQSETLTGMMNSYQLAKR